MECLKTAIQRYMSVCQYSKGLSPLTLKAYRIDLAQFLEYMVQKDFLSKDEISGYIDLLHQKYKPKSAKRKVASIKAFYHYLEMEDIIDSNPFHKITFKFKEGVVLPRTIPLDDVKRILNYAYTTYEDALTPCDKENRLRNIIVLELLFSTGMRVSEVSHLALHNLELANGTIHIWGKGSKERIMCITNTGVSDILRKYLQQRQSDSNYLFTNRLGNRLSEQSIRNMIRTYASTSGVTTHITPHMFRHTFATALLDRDVDIRYIQQLLGHSSITTTQIYTHISINRIRHILEARHPRNEITLPSI